MRIWHVGAAESPNRVDGVNATVWRLASEQASQGHLVTLVIGRCVDESGADVANKARFEIQVLKEGLLGFSPLALRSLLDRQPPDLVHMHSVFIPSHALLAAELRRRRIPYVVTPHAGLAPEVLARRPIRKQIYGALAERSRLAGAAALSTVIPSEKKEIEAYLGDYRGLIRWVPNPVDARQLQGGWSPDPDRPSMVYLGRFDVFHKGLDILMEIAQQIPHVGVNLYGAPNAEDANSFSRLLSQAPSNVQVHSPVYGRAKVDVLSRSTLYVQTSRWEGLSISISEAMYIGLPCAVASTMSLASLFEAYDLGLVLPPNPTEAAEAVSEAIASPERLQRWSERSREYARENFEPRCVAER